LILYTSVGPLGVLPTILPNSVINHKSLKILLLRNITDVITRFTLN